MARNNDLLRQLIASPHPLPAAQPRALTVAPAASLGAHAAFGPASPPALGRSGFSGAVSRSPVNVVHPQAPENFTSPSYQPLTAAQGVRPAALLPTLITALASGLGTGTGAVGAGGGTGTGGAITPPPVATRPTPAPYTSGPLPGVQYNAQGSTIGITQKLPTVSPSGVLGALLANPAVGKRGVYQV